ncbi:pyridine nucleotide-disulfide oxidoreductase, dimerization domain protein [Actinomyces urogenitalis DSM 15434]|uniref:Pyridine nucleotide-disulfide oxidoreductase, dimerization domain protein n=1 Tax=Actinomyces urogenitalis DSM 15434 TaxID=525246 RepID=C0W6X1_9ACTO|nr:pyridine nucleotide-disulfide oxidoreductase, dimerization domain protein [Actinomyces urogenitalis DSM 15434]
MVAAQLGAQVWLVEDRGLGGSAVLTDVVPSKTLVAAAESLAGSLADGQEPRQEHAPEMAALNARVRRLASEQSHDLTVRMAQKGIEVIHGRARLGSLDAIGTRTVHVRPAPGPWLGAGEQCTGAPVGCDVPQDLAADIILVATGARPRRLSSAEPDGRRILTWTQLYDLDGLPEHLIVVGSGVTGAEFAGAYLALGSRVTLVSSRERVLPTVDADAAELVEGRFRARGMRVLSGARAVAARVIADDGAPADESVEVELADGRVVVGSHCLMAVGAVPATAELGLAEAGVELTDSGHIKVDRVSRTTAYRVYAAGDCTGVLPLASVAAMQGRIAMRHALGDAVSPLEVGTVAQAVFTMPEIASIGIGEAEVKAYDAVSTTVPLARNPRAKMAGVSEGFVKLFSQRRSGEVLGGVIVGRAASEQVLAVTLAVTHRLTVEQVMNAFSVYPSLSGTITEAARQLHVR